VEWGSGKFFKEKGWAVHKSLVKNAKNNKKDIESTTDAVRDVVLVERTGCRNGPRGQRGVVGERGEEGFQLEVRAKRVCRPLCGDATKTLLGMPEMVVRRHFGLGVKPVKAVQVQLCGLSGHHYVMTRARKPASATRVSHVNTSVDFSR
jgi:hypothetical protein